MKCLVKITAELHYCADPDATSYALGGVYVVPNPAGGVFCIATTARALVVVPQEGEADGRYLFPAHLTKRAAKESGVLQIEYEEDRGRWCRSLITERDVTKRYADKVHGTYPPVLRVLPHLPSRVLEIAISPECLWAAINAMTDGETIRFLIPVPLDTNRGDPLQGQPTILEGPLVMLAGNAMAIVAHNQTEVASRLADYQQMRMALEVAYHDSATMPEPAVKSVIDSLFD